eukprot:7672969-Pyramimonas_sp.AAC.1
MLLHAVILLHRKHSLITFPFTSISLFPSRIEAWLDGWRFWPCPHVCTAFCLWHPCRDGA